MPSIFKYLPSKYIKALVERGDLLFRSLSYFRNYEEMQVRGDRHDGKRLYKPAHGLEITKTETGEKLMLPGTLESSVRDRDIYVFCFSHQRSALLAKEFDADACVEIHDPLALLSKVRSALILRRWVKHARLLHGRVDYYSPMNPPFAEWAVPERMVMRKTIDYSHQEEYRLAFARGDALRVNNVHTQITIGSSQTQPTLAGHPEHFLRLGRLANICTVHRFA